MKKVIFVMTCLIILSGCQPSSERIAVAIGLTQTAVALTQSILAITPTITETPQPTNTSIPTPSPTPDLRVIDGDSIDFLLVLDDLPKESQFYLPNFVDMASYEFSSRESNNEVIQKMGVDKGREFLERTGRVDGQWVMYARGSELLTAPEIIYCEVIEFKTAKGAQIALKEYNPIEKPYPEQTQYWAKEKFPLLGDVSIAYYYEWTRDSGEKGLQYNIEATYFNFYTSCAGYGRKNEVKPEYIANLITIIINKLKTAPLIAN